MLLEQRFDYLPGGLLQHASIKSMISNVKKNDLKWGGIIDREQK